MKVLLGGIPLGCDNIGDEAIIACVVKMLKKSLRGAEIAVATADPATEGRLGVAVVPPFGFANVPMDGFAEVVRRHDAYVWCGATGLSDYPHVALDLLEIAQREGVPTFVWGVGMNDELNPVFFRVHGRRRLVLSCLGLVGWYERRLRERLARRIAALLPRCRGVWLRDPESAAMLASLGFSGARIAADSAILLSTPRSPSSVPRSPTLGLCISTQNQVPDLDGVKGLVAAVRSAGARVLGIPMNPKTDRALMESLGVECVSGCTPESVSEAAAECDVVLSSRLHLLILAANVGTPVMGIARGSKLANWLANFGRTVEGSVCDCDWPKTTAHVLAALKDRGVWDEVRASAYARLTERLEKARGEFAAELEACNAK
ncbi:MAG: polysaccharide pyruvyl transferase family protein [Kiritimatiellae bacterium]|nr:polysaccharide pyruvyl transferase family protein [Kiritimatiellia bacterium]